MDVGIMTIKLTLISVEHRLKTWLGIQTIAEVYDDDSRIGDVIAQLWPDSECPDFAQLQADEFLKRARIARSKK
jgi:hypothetical protein